MDKEQLNSAFDVIAPSEKQKEKMLKEILCAESAAKINKPVFVKKYAVAAAFVAVAGIGAVLTFGYLNSGSVSESEQLAVADVKEETNVKKSETADEIEASALLMADAVTEDVTEAENAAASNIKQINATGEALKQDKESANKAIAENNIAVEEKTVESEKNRNSVFVEPTKSISAEKSQNENIKSSDKISEDKIEGAVPETVKKKTSVDRSESLTGVKTETNKEVSSNVQNENSLMQAVGTEESDVEMSHSAANTEDAEKIDENVKNEGFDYDDLNYPGVYRYVYGVTDESAEEKRHSGGGSGGGGGGSASSGGGSLKIDGVNDTAEEGTAEDIGYEQIKEHEVFSELLSAYSAEGFKFDSATQSEDGLTAEFSDENGKSIVVTVAPNGKTEEVNGEREENEVAVQCDDYQVIYQSENMDKEEIYNMAASSLNK